MYRKIVFSYFLRISEMETPLLMGVFTPKLTIFKWNFIDSLRGEKCVNVTQLNTCFVLLFPCLAHSTVYRAINTLLTSADKTLAHKNESYKVNRVKQHMYSKLTFQLEVWYDACSWSNLKKTYSLPLNIRTVLLYKTKHFLFLRWYLLHCLEIKHCTIKHN